MPFKTASIGGGVIGGAWAARFVLNGFDCAVYDPHPETERVVNEILANARKAFDQLTDAPKPEPGLLQFASELEEAVEEADLIQESIPERLELKQKVHMQIDSAAKEDALIGSSTSGFLPSDIQAKMSRPERMFVSHPYNPVYLLPLVELVGGRQTAKETLARAQDFYRQLGMKPIIIRKEIDAFVGDRLLEAVWREALWLVRDDICTVEELDDVIRYSFGLRWAQMGLFQTYRIAGGEAGMRHFIKQFGPTLALPWTKLMDVPELDDQLTDKIASQSDEQAKGLSIRELERIRDRNLTGFMRVLAQTEAGGEKGWGAGKILNDYENLLRRNAEK